MNIKRALEIADEIITDLAEHRMTQEEWALRVLAGAYRRARLVQGTAFIGASRDSQRLDWLDGKRIGLFLGNIDSGASIVNSPHAPIYGSNVRDVIDTAMAKEALCP